MHLLRLRATRQALPRISRRNLSIEPQPPSPTPQSPKQPSRVGAFYRSFSAPILKCFLGALFTYQLAYFGWMKLETIEETHDKKTEIKGLQEELAGAMNRKRREVEGVVGEKVGDARDRVLEGVDSVRSGKKSWWPW